MPSGCLLLLLPLLLSVLVLVPCVDGRPDAWETFRNQHVIPKMTAKDCDRVIRGRRILDAKGNCKPTNTFIIGDESNVASVCKSGKKYVNSNLVESVKQFNLIACKKTNQKCKYKGQKLLKKVVLACDPFPVHYQKDIRYTD